MSSLAQVAHALQHVLTEVPEALARTSGFCQRQSKLTATAFVQTTVLGWLAHPTGTLQRLTQRAADLGVRISPQGLAQRFVTLAVDDGQEFVQTIQLCVHLINPIEDKRSRHFGRQEGELGRADGPLLEIGQVHGDSG